MEHTNKIAIALLKNEYSDYPENAWHYDREYKMMVTAISMSTPPKVEREVGERLRNLHNELSQLLGDENSEDDDYIKAAENLLPDLHDELSKFLYPNLLK